MKLGAATTVVLLCCGVSAGCAQVAPPYAVSVDNVQRLRDSGAGKARVGRFESAPGLATNEAISLRGAPLTSPVGGTFTAYLEEALRTELRAARLFDDAASVEIGGVLMKNLVDISGISQGEAEIEARVIVRRAGSTRFDKVKRARVTFESSFAGAIAVPKGVQAYGDVAQSFLGAVYADADFLAALK